MGQRADADLHRGALNRAEPDHRNPSPNYKFDCRLQRGQEDDDKIDYCVGE